MTGDQRPFDSKKKLIEQLDIEFALQAAGLGIWEINPATNQVSWDERCQALVGLQHTNTIPFQQAIQYIHPDDLDHVRAAIQRATTPPSDGRFDETYRTLGADEGKQRWVRFWGQAQFTPSGELNRFSGIAQEVTGQVLAQQALGQQQAQERFLLQLSDALRSLTDPLVVYYQTACLVGQYLGANRVGYAADQGDGDTIVVLQNYVHGVADLQGTYHYADYGPLLAEFLAGRTVVRPDIAQDLTLTPDQKEAHRLLQLGATLNKPLLKDGRLLAVLFIHYQHAHHWSADELDLVEKVAERLVIAIDRAQTHEALRQSESRFRLLANSVPQAIWVTDAQGNTEFLNQWWVDYSGIPFEPSTAWQIAADILHPEDGPRLVAAFQQAMRTETSFEVEQRNRSALGEYRWFLNKGEPYHDPQTGQITKWVGAGVDIHDRKLAEQALQQSEARFRSLIEEAPVATCLFVGRALRIEVANEAMLAFWGKGPSVLGKPLEQAVPELVGQPFLTILDQVFTSGQTYTAHSMRADLEVDGLLGTYYFDFTYKPLRNAVGEVYAIMDMATDVTQQVKAQQSLLESESSLRAMIDLAELGRYTIDLVTNRMVKSPRLAQWYGLPEQTTVSASLDRVQEVDQQRVYQLFADALGEGASGVYDVEYGVISATTGQRRLLRTTGQVRYDADGRPIRVDGLAIDLTRQRELQWQLEEQVQQRTQELQLANQDLKRSNDNLQQFAYVASHDLQEPLRKIQSFSTLISQQLAGHPDPSVQQHLERIAGAGARMSTLIKDLLTYSRIATRQQAFGPVSLDAIMAEVLSTLDWEIHRTGARITVDELPVVKGDESQLGQLFQNLLTNAMKFVSPGQAPMIHVQYFHRSLGELPSEVRPSSQVPFYHQISVRDQGVGFDTKFVNRIFQVFQRLHGKNEYPGTGVGLAICQRVVENHGGGITASSEPGQGATFCVYLPA
ncbi:hypothetical protein GCM10028808_56320 [Spirosoma migulaei]